jgi:hypothetical protein
VVRPPASPNRAILLQQPDGRPGFAASGVLAASRKDHQVVDDKSTRFGLLNVCLFSALFAGSSDLVRKSMRFATCVCRYFERLGPYPSLFLLAVPLAIIEPLKLVAVVIFGSGHWLTGTLVMLGSYALACFCGAAVQVCEAEAAYLAVVCLDVDVVCRGP